VDELQPESADARLARGEQPFELHEKSPGGKKQRFGMRGLAGQLEPRREARRRDEEGVRFGHAAAGAIESIDHRIAAALRKACARQGERLADRGDADAAEECEIEAGDLERQLIETAAATAREPERGKAGRRGSERGSHAEHIQPGAQLVEKLLPPAEIAQASLDLGKQRVRRRERDLRRELASPARERRERLVRKAWKVQRDPEHGKVFSPAGGAARRAARRGA